MRYRGARKEEVASQVWTVARTFFTRESLYIHGTPGVGKTSLAALLLMTVLRRNFMVMIEQGWNPGDIAPFGMYVFSPSIFFEIKATWRETSKYTEKDIIDRYSSIHCLILDDIGVEKNSEKTIEALNSIIDYRYREMKHTVFTSNLALEQLANKLGDRIVSRITEMCGYGRGVIEITGDDRRLKGDVICR